MQRATKIIYKYTLSQITGKQPVIIPDGAKILSVQIQDTTLCFWAQLNPAPDIPKVTRYFEVIATGEPFSYFQRTYLGTVQQGPFVWHIFERHD